MPNNVSAKYINIIKLEKYQFKAKRNLIEKCSGTDINTATMKVHNSLCPYFL